jgi:putative ABC transport system permease protein
MSFLGLLVRNLWTRKVRTLLTGFAVAIAVMTVVTLGVVTSSLRDTAASVIHTGEADFTVGQAGVSDVLNSVVQQRQVDEIAQYPQVESVVGALIVVHPYDADNPLFINIGIAPDKLAAFGVRVVRGVAPEAGSKDQVILGTAAAENLGKRVGDTVVFDTVPYRVTGIYHVGQQAGDGAAIMPLAGLQGHERTTGQVTLAFVKVQPGTSKAELAALRKRIERDHPSLATIASPSEFGRVDRSLELLSAAERGATILAVVIGAIIVTNTMLLSFFERTREFGVMRAVGWSRKRVLALVVLEALVISVLGAALGVALSFVATIALQEFSSISGFLDPQYSAGIFWRALYIAIGIGFLGAIYPSARAAFLRPLDALRHE